MSKSVLSREEAERVAVVYSPPKFPFVVSRTAHDFIALQSNLENEPSFRIDKIVAQQTGIAELERLSIEEKVEREALVRLKETQEEAYRVAYELGQAEGRQKAFEDAKVEFANNLQHLETILRSIETLKTDLITHNETQILNLIFNMAKRLVLSEVSTRRETVLDVVRQAIESAQSDEQVTVRLSFNDLTFVEGIRERLGKDFETLKKAKLESSDDIADGGCVIETNYGQVNASIDQRLEKLWSAISEKLPKIKDVIGSSGEGNGG